MLLSGEYALTLEQSHWSSMRKHLAKVKRKNKANDHKERERECLLVHHGGLPAVYSTIAKGCVSKNSLSLPLILLCGLDSPCACHSSTLLSIRYLDAFFSLACVSPPTHHLILWLLKSNFENKSLKSLLVS